MINTDGRMTRRLFPEERYRVILTSLDERGHVSVQELCNVFEISPVTIRNDLKVLASRNLLFRTHGGAIALNHSADDLSFDTRLSLHSPEKNAIGMLAASLVKNGDVIALDASTTALTILEHLKNVEELTVVTNGLAVANALIHVPGITVILLGGFLRRDALTFSGSFSTDYLDNLQITKSFISARGLSVDRGLTELSDQEGEVKRKIIDAAEKVIAVIDSSKIGLTSLHRFAELTSIHTLITDDGIKAADYSAIQNVGIDILIAK